MNHVIDRTTPERTPCTVEGCPGTALLPGGPCARHLLHGKPVPHADRLRREIDEAAERERSARARFRDRRIALDPDRGPSGEGSK